MMQFKVRAKGRDLGLFSPIREYDTPKNNGMVFGIFTPFEAYSGIAHLYRYSDERGGNDWDNSPETNEKRKKLELGLFTDTGDEIPTAEITIYDCTVQGVACELHVQLFSREHVEFVLSSPK